MLPTETFVGVVICLGGKQGSVSEITPSAAPRSRQIMFIVGVVVLAFAVAGALYFMFQAEVPTVLAVFVGLLVAGIAVGRFYLVAKYELFNENRY